MAIPNRSNGYEEIAPTFIAGRGQNVSGIGASVVADWSKMLPDGATVLDLGCGTGVPITKILIERGFKVYGVDASASMIAAFRARFPANSDSVFCCRGFGLFGRTFEGVVAWGLFFLLDAEVQRKLIAKIAAVLPRGGRLLFTATKQSCTWTDAMTERPSISLGHEIYKNTLEAENLSLVGTMLDVGENFYYFARKT